MAGSRVAGFATRQSGTSGFRGVSWHTQTGRWKSQIKVAGKDINLGRHLKETAAAQVRALCWCSSGRATLA